MVRSHKKTETGRFFAFALQMHLSYITQFLLPLSYRQSQELWKSTDNLLFLFNNLVGFLKVRQHFPAKCRGVFSLPLKGFYMSTFNCFLKFPIRPKRNALFFSFYNCRRDLDTHFWNKHNHPSEIRKNTESCKAFGHSSPFQDQLLYCWPCGGWKLSGLRSTAGDFSAVFWSIS